MRTLMQKTDLKCKRMLNYKPHCSKAIDVVHVSAHAVTVERVNLKSIKLSNLKIV